MEKNVFNCPHCGKEIFVSSEAEAAQAEKPIPAILMPEQPSPDEIETTAIEVDLPLKDVILEPDPIEDIAPEDAFDEIEPEPIEEIEELSPEDIKEFASAHRSPARKPSRPPHRPSQDRKRGGGRPDRARKPQGRGAHNRGADGGFDVVLDPINDRELEDIAIDLIMDIARVNERKAEGILDKPTIVVLKNVSRDEAEDALAAFEDEGITGSVKRRRPRR